MADGGNQHYMLAHREHIQEEVDRLDRQHRLIVEALFNGRLVHKTVPLQDVKAVADIGTGTGVWLAEFQKEHQKSLNLTDLVGFDISDAKFNTRCNDAGIRLCLHDTTSPFPAEFHNKFDLVNVRLLNYAILKDKLPAMMANIAQILRPGGFLQWQESDYWDVFPVPFSDAVQEGTMEVNKERAARGLSSFLPPYLMKTMLSLKVPPFESDSLVKPPSEDLFRIRVWKTKPAAAAPLARELPEQLDKDIQALILEGLVNLIDAATHRISGLEKNETDETQKAEFNKRLESIKTKREALLADLDSGKCKLGAYATWAIAQKQL